MLVTRKERIEIEENFLNDAFDLDVRLLSLDELEYLLKGLLRVFSVRLGLENDQR